MKKLFKYFPQGSPMYIVLHAKYRRSRGRQPVAVSPTERNSRKALRAAYAKLARGIIVRTGASASVLCAAMKQAGVRPLSLIETLAVIQRQRVINAQPTLILTWADGRWNVEHKKPLDENWNIGSHSCFVPY